MLAFLRFLVVSALIALFVSFFASIFMGYLFAHPEVKTFGQLFR